MDELGPKLTLSPEAMDLIRNLSSQSPSAETGGILIGYHSGTDIHVVKATDAGPNARRSQCGFLRDTAYCQKALDDAFASSGADYLGEWHTHVIDLPRPSDGDLMTLTGIVLDPDYNFPSFAMVLAIVQGDLVEIQGYIAMAEAANGKPKSRLVRVIQTHPKVTPLPDTGQVPPVPRS